MSLAAEDVERYFLLSDGSLRLEIAGGLEGLVQRWLPRALPDAALPSGNGADRAADRAVIRIAFAPPATRPTSADTPLLRLGTVSLWPCAERGNDVLLMAGAGPARGVIDLAAFEARLEVPAAHDAGRTAWDVHSMLTLASALLSGRLGSALVHAAAIQDPAGRGWLVVGDTHAGKTTTTLNLIRAGWNFLSDDQVVLSPRPGSDGVHVEGWLRPFHPDEGWDADAPSGRRVALDALELEPGSHRRTTVASILLFPQVVPDQPTMVTPMVPAEAMELLIRQTPWLLADRAAAPSVLDLLQKAVELPAWRLRLGLDTYGRGERVAALLTAL
jgi:hypothetical protein